MAMAQMSPEALRLVDEALMLPLDEQDLWDQSSRWGRQPGPGTIPDESTALRSLAPLAKNARLRDDARSKNER